MYANAIHLEGRSFLLSVLCVQGLCEQVSFRFPHFLVAGGQVRMRGPRASIGTPASQSRTFVKLHTCLYWLLYVELECCVRSLLAVCAPENR